MVERKTMRTILRQRKQSEIEYRNNHELVWEGVQKYEVLEWHPDGRRKRGRP